MQGSFSILSMLYRSCSIRTDFPVPRSPARIVRLFRGMPFGRTLSTASIPVSNDFGSKGTLSNLSGCAVEIKDIVTTPTLGPALGERHEQWRLELTQPSASRSLPRLRETRRRDRGLCFQRIWAAIVLMKVLSSAPASYKFTIVLVLASPLSLPWSSLTCLHFSCVCPLLEL